VSVSQFFKRLAKHKQQFYYFINSNNQKQNTTTTIVSRERNFFLAQQTEKIKRPIKQVVFPLSLTRDALSNSSINCIAPEKLT
jgi:hypothetical protein